MRTDIKFPKGALAANAAHASVAAIFTSESEGYTEEYLRSLPTMRKVCLKVDTESQLLELYEQIKEKAYLWTEQPENIPVALATFPRPKEEYQHLVSTLKLL